MSSPERDRPADPAQQGTPATVPLTEVTASNPAATAAMRATATMQPAEPLVNNRYRIERELSRGGLGVVYLARDEKLHGRRVVIKVPLGLHHDDWLTAKFAEEIRALSIIDHPGVVGVLDSGQMPQGQPFFVMQFVEGQPLRALLTAGGLPFNQASDIIQQIGHALSAAHAKGVWHRDLKPENVMVQSAPGGALHVRLVDFGIATVTSQAAEAVTRVAGSVPYMSPEQLEGRVSAATDIYALGVIAFEMLTGHRPFSGTDPVTLHRQQEAGVTMKPTALRPHLPAGAERLLLRALSFCPEDRPSSPSAFAEELASALTAEPSVEPIQKNRRRGTLRVIVTAVLALAGATPWWTLSHTSPPFARTNLSYSLLVQPLRDGEPAGNPELARIAARLHVSEAFSILVRSNRPGYVYVLSDDSRSLITLFPTPFMYAGSSQIGAEQQKKIPEHSWYRFDPEPSTQDVWLVWSANSLPEFEALRKWANSKDRGVIDDARERDSIRSLLTAAARDAKLRTQGDTEQTVTSAQSRFAWKLHLETTRADGKQNSQ